MKENSISKKLSFEFKLSVGANLLMKRFLIFTLLFSLATATYGQDKNNFEPFRLIAHRGGVVSDQAPENSLLALKEAIAKGYYMVEIDVRLTKDSVLITNHDADFKKDFNIDKKVSDMTWEEIQQMSHPNGHKVQLFEEVLAYSQGKIEVMIDNKIVGYDKALFESIVELLRKYKLLEAALMIGTEESTEFFTGKVRLSCTREQIEENQARNDYQSSNYFLFGRDLSVVDVKWAEEKKIMTVAAINSFSFPKDSFMKKAKQQINQLKSSGVLIFQIDSVFEDFF
jgi:glycerophosphoryl diester phosphodiesterase